MRFRITTLDGSQGVAVQQMDALDEADAHRQALARGLRVLAIQAARLKGSRRARLSLVAFSNELVALLEAGLSLVEAIDALTEKERDESVRHLARVDRLELESGRDRDHRQLGHRPRHGQRQVMELGGTQCRPRRGAYRPA